MRDWLPGEMEKTIGEFELIRKSLTFCIMGTKPSDEDKIQMHKLRHQMDQQYIQWFNKSKQGE